MQRTDFAAMECSIARTIDIAGEPWTPLILRDLWVGIRRFDALRGDLGISRKVLAERLRRLEGAGVIERHPYSTNPPRDEYHLTEKGWDLCDVLLAISAWGDRWTAGAAGPPVLLRHHGCGSLTHAEIRCARCGERLHARELDAIPASGDPITVGGAQVGRIADG